MKYIKLTLLTLALMLVLTTSSLAEEPLMNVATAKAIQIFNHVKMIIFVVGGFGLVGIAFQAIFGKVKWTWFAGLAVGLAILAAAGAIVNYATGAHMSDGTTSAAVVDTFGQSDEGSFAR